VKQQGVQNMSNYSTNHQEGVANGGQDCAVFVIIHALPSVFVDETVRKALLAKVGSTEQVVSKQVLAKVEKYAPVKALNVTVGLGMELASLVFPRYAKLPKYRTMMASNGIGMQYTGGMYTMYMH